MTGNPFRRPPSNRPEDDNPRDPTPPSSKIGKKKVKIQTPPHSPEDPPRRLSAGNISPPPPPQQNDSDDSDSTATADSELEEASRNTRRNSGPLTAPVLPPALPSPAIRAPYNPFARTLATTEAAYGLQQPDGQEDIDSQARPNAGRPAMNVEDFKNILLGSSAAPSPPSYAVQGNGGSGKDTSSASRQSFFDAQYNEETPRSSFDHMDDLESASSDGDEHSSLMSGADRLDDLAPPAPPKQSTSGPVAPRGPQTVSFEDFDQSLSSPPSLTRIPTLSTSEGSSGKLRPAPLKREPSDLNKPLPQPPPQSPTATGTLADAAEITTSQPYEPPAEDYKKVPPPPPVARRMRAGSNPKQETTQVEGKTSTPKPSDSPAAKAIVPPPPPPPSRKTKPAISTPKVALDAQPIGLSSSESPPRPSLPQDATKPMPPPPPPRSTPKQPTTLIRSTSDSSQSSTPRVDTSSSSSQPQIQSQNQNTPPAPPPPRRAAASSNRTSMDGRPASLKDYRRSSAQSVDTQRSNSLQNLTEIQEGAGDGGILTATASMPSGDILADMSAFQAEIDALRAKAGNG